MTKKEALTAQFKKAYASFVDGLELAASDAPTKEKMAYRDSVIQRFEFCTDLAWKSMREILENRFGVAVTGPKPIIREAFAHNLISDEALWLDIIEMRNETSHTYDEAEIAKIFEKMPQVKALFEMLTASL